MFNYLSLGVIIQITRPSIVLFNVRSLKMYNIDSYSMST